MADRELPNNEMQFQALKAKGLALYCTCITCNHIFTGSNVKTTRGWRETQISGMCETCFDDLFEYFNDL